MDEKEIEKFTIAMENVPHADVKLIKDFLTSQNQINQNNDDELRAIVVNTRWENRICEQCGNKQEVEDLKRCTRCYLAFYCNSQCQRAHWEIHKLRCGKLDGPLDTGYQAMKFLKIEPEEPSFNKPE